MDCSPGYPFSSEILGTLEGRARGAQVLCWPSGRRKEKEKGRERKRKEKEKEKEEKEKGRKKKKKRKRKIKERVREGHTSHIMPLICKHEAQVQLYIRMLLRPIPTFRALSPFSDPRPVS